MTRLRILGGIVATVTVVAALVLVEGASKPAIADVPQPVARFKAHLQNFQTVWSIPTYNNGTLPGFSSFLIRWDAGRGIGTLDDGPVVGAELASNQ